ncbi:ligase-associated DNA damage response DEXH box helicase [Sphingobium sp. DEHP117]|uniref:ligase-associated DNA damage response DEXH box helicase n=1 Tax=Sphingobium sp. DEHP117 TaxID=2993436 RepID=UPI0027D5F124|nr:ligase-associated DNA damage response DEXH box helicase [Sphingobium sp. DEHP117]MDQ4419018.1 ligase-associated DNA damage response DEXH box helicase [Sphingobium sp. DEHP117]
MSDSSLLPAAIEAWFAGKGWAPRAHQLAMLEADGAGRDALLASATGSGKTLAGFLPSLADLADGGFDGLHTLYVSPLKALTNDIERNLVGPIGEMGLPISIETRTGDTSFAVKARQRKKPPQILLTTPESLSLLLSHPDSFHLFPSLKRVVIDEVHAFAHNKRGDLLALCLARLARLAPAHRRAALSATIADATPYQEWLSRRSTAGDVALVTGAEMAPPEIHILSPEGRIPWSGHSARYAAAEVMEAIRQHRLTLVFCNTRALAELTLQELWAINTENLPIGIFHGSLSLEVRQRAEAGIAEGRLRALVCTSALDLGVDWGDVDLVIQMGAPKGTARLLQRIGRSNHRADTPSKAFLIPGNRFEYLEARAALDAIEEGVLDAEFWRPGALDVLAQHIMAMACAAPFDADDLFAEVASARPYRELDHAQFHKVLNFVANGGYALSHYDRFQRLRKDADGLWRVSLPRFVAQYRMNAGIIVEAPMLKVRFRNGRTLGQLEEGFGSSLRPGDTFRFSGLDLEVESIRDTDLIVRASRKSALIPSYTGARMALTTSLSDRVRALLRDRAEHARLPKDVKEWLAAQARFSVIPAPDQLLVETFPHHGLHHIVIHGFEGWNAHQSLGMLITQRMEKAKMKPLGFVANDYSLAAYGLMPISDPGFLLDPEVIDDELTQWVEQSYLLKRAFREVAVISGLVERQHPGRRKNGKQVTFSTDLIYDVLQKHEPDHILLRAAWDDASTRLVEVARLKRLLERARETMLHADLPRVSPLSVPALVIIGRERVAGGEAEDALIAELEAMIADTGETTRRNDAQTA